jgi:hypothetical protein
MGAVLGASVELVTGGAQFRLTTGVWSGVYPIEALGRSIEFYRFLRDRRGGAYSAQFETTVRVLEELQQDLKTKGKPASL